MRSPCSGILPKEDDDTIALIEAALREDGVRLLTHTRTLRCEVVDGEQRLVVTSGPGVHPDQSSGGEEEALPFDLLLCAIGRRARVTGFGLEALGIPLTAAGTIETGLPATQVRLLGSGRMATEENDCKSSISGWLRSMSLGGELGHRRGVAGAVKPVSRSGLRIPSGSAPINRRTGVDGRIHRQSSVRKAVRSSGSSAALSRSG